MAELTVFTARRIITMNPSWPEGTAVAVREGRIVEVGSLDSLQPWLAKHEHQIDERFSDQVMLPGLIDPHLHPAMAAVLLPMRFITAMEWNLPWERVAPVTTHDGFMRRLRELHEAMEDPDEPLFTWGYHHLWHGSVRREQINSVSKTRPIVVWQRSFHELMMNDGMLDLLGLDAELLEGRPQIDYPGGHFYENGAFFAIGRMAGMLLSPERFAEGIRRLREVAHFGGHTTIGDMALGIFDFDTELEAMRKLLDDDETPFRTVLVPTAKVMALRNGGSNEAGLAYVESLVGESSHRLRFGKRIKLFTDGAFFSQLAMMNEPGYIDGHHGEWITEPEEFEAQARTYWNVGYRIHVHCTGDLGLELALDTLEKLQWERPRFNHGFTIEHFGFSTPEQVERLALLGGSVSANVYYLHELSDVFTKAGIGTERAEQMARLGSCFRAGIRTALHSDFTMAPALPLNSAWVAVNRINAVGKVVGPEERLSVEQALESITIHAAAVLGLQDEVGSIRSGKRADFAVVDADPFEVGAQGLKDISVLATVFEGQVYPVSRHGDG